MIAMGGDIRQKWLFIVVKPFDLTSKVACVKNHIAWIAGYVYWKPAGAGINNYDVLAI